MFEKASTHYNKQNAETKDLISRTDEIIHTGMKSHTRWVQIYSKALNYLLNGQLEGKKREKGWQKIQINKILPAINQSIAMAANRDTDLVGQPYMTRDYKGSAVWSAHLKWQYEKGVSMDKIRRQMIVSGNIFGRYIVRPFWDPKAKWNDRDRRWEGALKIRCEKPENVVVDPNLQSEHIEDAEYIYIRKRRSVREVVKKHPKFKEAIMHAAEGDTDELGKEIGLYEKAKVRIQRLLRANNSRDEDIGDADSSALLLDALQPAEKEEQNAEFEHEEAPRYVTVYEIYMKDDATVTRREEEYLAVSEFPQGAITEDEDGIYKVGDPEFFKQYDIKVRKGQAIGAGTKNWPKKVTSEWEEPLYPYGRLVIRCGDVILNPEKKDQKIPYKSGWNIVVGQHLPLPFSPHGMNGIELGRHLQNWLNVVASGVAAHVLTSAYPPLKVEQGAVASDPENRHTASRLAQKPMAIWKMKPGKIEGAQYEQPGQLSNEVTNFYNMISTSMDDMLNSQNVMKGRASSGEQTGTEVATLARNAAQQLDLAGNMLDEKTLELCEHCLDILRYHHNAGDTVRVTGEDFTEDIEVDGDVITVPQRVVQLEDGDFTAEFDLTMEVQEHSPFSKEARKADASAVMESLGEMSPTVIRRFLQAHGVTEIDRVMDEYSSYMDSMAAAEEAAAEQEQEQASGET